MSFTQYALQLSEQQDCRQLTNHLIQALTDIAGVRSAQVFEVYCQTAGDGVPVQVNRTVIRGFADSSSDDRHELDTSGVIDAVERAEAMSLQGDAGQRWLYPVLGSAGPARVVSVAMDPSEPVEQEPVVTMVKLYQNLLVLIDRMERDRLTGLLNRHTLDNRLLELTRSLASGKGCWLALLDIDHFKKINDTYGHAIGDETLLSFSQLMKRNFRYTDSLYRFGGEEFLVVLTDTNELGARFSLERFRQMVETFAFPRVNKVTVSIGYTAVTTGSLPDVLLHEADKALYYAKEHGRNRVVTMEAATAEVDPEKTVDLFR